MHSFAFFQPIFEDTEGFLHITAEAIDEDFYELFHSGISSPVLKK